MDGIVSLLLLVVGFVVLVKGADWFVEGACGIAVRFGIPQLVIGLTVVAFGTSAPEAAVSINAGLRGNAGISVGNIVGSNILNILIILGVTALIAPLAVQKSTVVCEIPYMIVITVVLFLLGMAGSSLSLTDGVFLWIGFLLFLAYLLWMSKKGGSEQPQEEKQSAWKCVLFTATGIVMVVVGSDLAVDGATGIAQAAGISQRFIGLTIVALGTSLPELVTSVLAARKQKADLAIGNIVGSNIFNILFVLGTTALITPVPFPAVFGIDTLIAVAAAVLLFFCVWKKQRLTRTAGVVMLCGYAAYFIYLIV